MSHLMTALAARAKLPVGDTNTLFATVTFDTPEVEASTRVPLDLAVVLDVSGSMSGAKLDYAKKSLYKLLEHLTASDRLAVVAYGSQVKTLLEPMSMDETGKRLATERIRAQGVMGCTNLSGGLAKGLDHLASLPIRKGSVRRCMLFTDGQANEGITDSEGIARLAKELRNKAGISTFGYGSNCNEDLLQTIAKSCEGDFYYIDNPDKILTAFGAELGGLVSTWAQNVELRLTPPDGVTILKVLNDLSVDNDGKVAVVHCDDLLSGQRDPVVVQLEIEAKNKVLPRGGVFGDGSLLVNSGE